ncbi:lysine transporter LysE [Comamonas serinivorans]|uniref:Lysine transporter LysE n=1 Tax=Comamonas serinivorans TaxID=1082851 RepID=A0A1Y0EIF1_9BURK|nr:LysE family translocator [Comamonas serinivorans]ARU03385.1 lysine transporter LysE [Comamonas serinivorans]
MSGISDYWAFVGAIVVFLLIPGPGNLALVSSTGRGGVRAGIACTLGVMLADQVLMWAAVAGLAAMLAAMPAVFAGVQWLGAAYLVWLGWRMVRSAPGERVQLAVRSRHHLMQGILVTLLNPKAIVFYMAFFPLFLKDKDHASVATFAAMAATVAVLTLAYGVIAASITQAMAGRLRANPVVGRILEKLAGLALIGFGVRLALR